MSIHRHPRAKGLTLLEVLITMLLVSMAFAMTAILVRNFSSVNAHLDGKEGTQQGSLLLLRIAAELEEAFEVTSPASGGPVTEIRLAKYAPTPDRLANTAVTPPAVPPVPTSSSWAPDYVLSVRYFQDEENLVRQTSYPDGSVEKSRLISRLSGFSATRVNPRAIEVRATFRESKKLQIVTTLAYRWGE